jgi:CTD small phosphatase-like protein 2
MTHHLRCVARDKLLVLDLDETIMHACSVKDKPDVTLIGRDPANKEFAVSIKVRPFVQEFLEKVSKEYEIILFTASTEHYATTIIDYIDPNREYFKTILSRRNCMETKNGFFIKDLRILKGRDLAKVVIIDNLAHCFGFQIDNGIPILDFISDENDVELLYLADYLLRLAKAPDVRVILREEYKLKQLSEIDNESDLLNY